MGARVKESPRTRYWHNKVALLFQVECQLTSQEITIIRIWEAIVASCENSNTKMNLVVVWCILA
jgi:hypothetical protein